MKNDMEWKVMHTLSLSHFKINKLFEIKTENLNSLHFKVIIPLSNMLN